MEVDPNLEDEIEDEPQLSLPRRSRRRTNETEEERARRRDEDAERHRLRRSRETEDQREQRRSHGASRDRARRALETNEETEHRRAQVATRARYRRSTETREEREHRRALNASTERRRRAMETAEERERRRTQNASRERIRRSMETEEETEQRRAQNVLRGRIRRTVETDAERENRRSQNALNQRTRLARESSPETQIRRQQNARAHAAARRRPVRRSTHRIAASDAIPQIHYMGTMSETCSSCQAKYFRSEAKKKAGKYNPCCNHGKVALHLFVDYPTVLKNLFTGEHPKSRNFLEYTRNFNNSLAIASMDCKVERIPGRGPYHFRMHGAVYHHVGPAIPVNDPAHLSYGQLYILDTNQASVEREGHKANINCDSELMRILSRFMSEHNPYAQAYQMLYEVYRHEDSVSRASQVPIMDIRMFFHVDPTLDKRRYNKPTANEVAVVYVGPDGDIPEIRKYSVHARSGTLIKVDLTNKELDPMLYPLFFLRSDEGWHPELKKINGRKRISQKEYYSYLLSVRNQFNPLHWARKLLQQFVVDSWAKIEQNRLNYIRLNQSEMRAEKYQLLEDFINEGTDGLAGAKIILPSSHTNSPRYMKQCYQDAMSIVTRFGKPDFFCTFTCNPKWKEIQENLYAGQRAEDRPDIVARVFRLKLAELMQDIKQRQVFGRIDRRVLLGRPVSDMYSYVVVLCGDHGGCPVTCPNRIKNFRMKNQLEVFRREKVMGFGIRTLNSIATGEMVIEYVGCVQPNATLTAESRDYAYELHRKPDLYYLMDRIKSATKSTMSEEVWEDEMVDLDVYSINPYSKGNLSRFLNLSCYPNLIGVICHFLHPVRHHMFMVATCYISAGTELTIHCGSEYSEMRELNYLCGFPVCFKGKMRKIEDVVPIEESINAFKFLHIAWKKNSDKKYEDLKRRSNSEEKDIDEEVPGEHKGEPVDETSRKRKVDHRNQPHKRHKEEIDGNDSGVESSFRKNCVIM